MKRSPLILCLLSLVCLSAQAAVPKGEQPYQLALDCSLDLMLPAGSPAGEHVALQVLMVKGNPLAIFAQVVTQVNGVSIPTILPLNSIVEGSNGTGFAFSNNDTENFELDPAKPCSVPAERRQFS